MTKNQFALIITVWLVVMAVIFCTPARALEIGLTVAPVDHTCQDSVDNMKAVISRLHELRDAKAHTFGTSDNLILNAEIKGVQELGIKIFLWRNENCKES